MYRVLFLGWLLLAGVRATEASAPATLLGSPEPAWEGVRWIANAPARGLAPTDFRGKVLVVWFFESGSDAGLGALAEAKRTLAADGDVAFVAVQWLGWREAPTGTPEAGAKRLRDHGLDVPHAALLGEPERAHLIPAARYAVTGYPWLHVVDRAGVVRFEGAPGDAARIVSAVRTLQAVRGAAHALVGQRFGTTAPLRGFAARDGSSPFAGKPLTLLRWWTNACPHCTGSVPSLARLGRKHGARGLSLVAVYHPKGRPLTDESARQTAAQFGVSGTVAFDDRWTKYLELRDRGALRTATSISVLVDSDGVIRWVHPGPRLQDFGDPTRDGTEAFAELDRLVDRLLPPPAPPATGTGAATPARPAAR
jgi:hypothetical protein